MGFWGVNSHLLRCSPTVSDRHLNTLYRWFIKILTASRVHKINGSFIWSGILSISTCCICVFCSINKGSLFSSSAITFPQTNSFATLLNIVALPYLASSPLAYPNSFCQYLPCLRRRIACFLISYCVSGLCLCVYFFYVRLILHKYPDDYI